MVIFTKYHGPTNIKGGRISAHAPGENLPRVSVSYPHEKSGADCHADAVRKLMTKIGPGKAESRVFYALPIPGGYCFVETTGADSFSFEG